MSRLASRISRLERRRPDPQFPRFVPFPTEGMSTEEIEREWTRRKARGRLTEEKFVAKYAVELPHDDVCNLVVTRPRSDGY